MDVTSAAARAFAAQQHRRQRRLILSELLRTENDRDQVSARPVAEQRQGPAAAAADGTSSQHPQPATSSQQPPVLTAKRSSCSGRPSASELRALATLRRLHPTALRSVQRGRGGYAGLMGRIWHKPFPWGGATRQIPTVQDDLTDALAAAAVQEGPATHGAGGSTVSSRPRDLSSGSSAGGSSRGTFLPSLGELSQELECSCATPMPPPRRSVGAATLTNTMSRLHAACLYATMSPGTEPTGLSTASRRPALDSLSLMDTVTAAQKVSHVLVDLLSLDIAGGVPTAGELLEPLARDRFWRCLGETVTLRIWAEVDALLTAFNFAAPPELCLLDMDLQPQESNRLSQIEAVAQGTLLWQRKAGLGPQRLQAALAPFGAAARAEWEQALAHMAPPGGAAAVVRFFWTDPLRSTTHQLRALAARALVEAEGEGEGSGLPPDWQWLVERAAEAEQRQQQMARPLVAAQCRQYTRQLTDVFRQPGGYALAVLRAAVFGAQLLQGTALAREERERRGGMHPLGCALAASHVMWQRLDERGPVTGGPAMNMNMVWEYAQLSPQHWYTVLCYGQLLDINGVPAPRRFSANAMNVLFDTARVRPPELAVMAAEAELFRAARWELRQVHRQPDTRLLERRALDFFTLCEWQHQAASEAAAVAAAAGTNAGCNASTSSGVRGLGPAAPQPSGTQPSQPQPQPQRQPPLSPSPNEWLRQPPEFEYFVGTLPREGAAHRLRGPDPRPDVAPPPSCDPTVEAADLRTGHLGSSWVHLLWQPPLGAFESGSELVSGSEAEIEVPEREQGQEDMEEEVFKGELEIHTGNEGMQSMKALADEEATGGSSTSTVPYQLPREVDTPSSSEEDFEEGVTEQGAAQLLYELLPHSEHDDVYEGPASWLGLLASAAEEVEDGGMASAGEQQASGSRSGAIVAAPAAGGQGASAPGGRERPDTGADSGVAAAGGAVGAGVPAGGAEVVVVGCGALTAAGEGAGVGAAEGLPGVADVADCEGVTSLRTPYGNCVAQQGPSPPSPPHSEAAPVGLFDCLWAPIDFSGEALPGNGFDLQQLLHCLGQFDFLDVEYDAAAEQHIRDALQQANDYALDERAMQEDAQMGMAMGFANSTALRRRCREHEETRERRLKLHAEERRAVQEVESSRGVAPGSVYRGLIERLRPGLVAAHPGSWGGLLRAAATNRRSVLEALDYATVGLAALAGQPIGLPDVRLAYCAVAGYFTLVDEASVWGSDDDEDDAAAHRGGWGRPQRRSIGMAVEVFHIVSALAPLAHMHPEPRYVCEKFVQNPVVRPLPAGRGPIPQELQYHTLMYLTSRIVSYLDVVASLAAYVRTAAQRRPAGRRPAGAASSGGDAAAAAAMDREQQLRALILHLAYAAMTNCASDYGSDYGYEVPDSVSVSGHSASGDSARSSDRGGAGGSGSGSGRAPGRARSGDGPGAPIPVGEGGHGAGGANRGVRAPVSAPGVSGMLPHPPRLAQPPQSRLTPPPPPPPPPIPPPMPQPPQLGPWLPPSQSGAKPPPPGPSPSHPPGCQQPRLAPASARSEPAKGAAEGGGRCASGTPGSAASPSVAAAFATTAAAVAAGPDGGGGRVCTIGPNSSVAEVVEGLLALATPDVFLASCGALSSPPPPPPPPVSVRLVGPEHTALALCVLNQLAEMSGGPQRAVFYPYVSTTQATAAKQQQQSTSQQQAARREPPEVLLARIQPGVVPLKGDARFSEGYRWRRAEDHAFGHGLTPSTSNANWSAYLRASRDALVKHRLGLCWINGKGVETFASALRMAAEVRATMEGKGLSCSTCVADVKVDEKDWAGNDGGTGLARVADAWTKCVHTLAKNLLRLKMEEERVKTHAAGGGAGRPVPWVDALGLLNAAVRDANHLLAFVADANYNSLFRAKLKVQLLVVEHESGRPDRPVQPQAQTAEKKRLKAALMARG